MNHPVIPIGHAWNPYANDITGHIEYTRYFEPYASVAARKLIAQCGLSFGVQSLAGKAACRSWVLRAAQGPQHLGENI
jgi:hypothetical protein